METKKMYNEANIRSLVIQDDLTLAEIVRRYKSIVHTLAFDLTGSLSAAEQVTMEVFVRLSKEHHICQHEPIDAIIHRFTYDASLPLLLTQITELTDPVDPFGIEVEEEAEQYRMVC